MNHVLIPVAIVLSASAQILLKRASVFENWSMNWLILLGSSGVLYVGALFTYMQLMRSYPISRIYPTLTVLVIGVITVYGALTGEHVSLRQVAGLALGGAAVYLLLG